MNKSGRSKLIAAVMAQREEILEAFVAKYGFQPDECQQVQEPDRWFVIRLEPEKVARVTRAIILVQLKQKKYTRWQMFCLRLARLTK